MFGSSNFSPVMTVLDLRVKNDCKRRPFMLISAVAPLVATLTMHCIFELHYELIIFLHTLPCNDAYIARSIRFHLLSLLFCQQSSHMCLFMSFISKTKLILLSMMSLKLLEQPLSI